MDIKEISAFHSHAYPCRKELKGLMRIYSQASLFSFLFKAAQAGAWISSRSPKLKRERQQLVAGTNEAFAEFVRSSFLPFSPKGGLLSSQSSKGKEEHIPWQIYLSKGYVLL